MDADPDLRTPRLTLRRWRRADEDRVLDLYGRPEVMRWLGDGPPQVMETLAQARRAVDRWAALSSAPPLGCWAAEVSEAGPRRGTVAGTVLLVRLGDRPGPGDPEVEIAWHFHPDSWGHGYATEAAAALLAHGFAEGLERIWALTHLGHDRSMRVCERIGLRQVGREQPWYDAEMEVFRLTAEEYAGSR